MRGNSPNARNVKIYIFWTRLLYRGVESCALLAGVLILYHFTRIGHIRGGGPLLREGGLIQATRQRLLDVPAHSPLLPTTQTSLSYESE